MQFKDRISNPSLLPGFLFLFLASCSKPGGVSNPPTPPPPPPPSMPVMGSTSQGSLGRTYAVLTGTISSGTGITARGFCWALTPAPTISNNVLISTGTGSSYTDSIKGLTYNTNYYARAYATNSAGTSYSAEIQFRTMNSLYTIGQLTMGGKIFYIDSTGEHGLVYPPAYNYIHRRWAAHPYHLLFLNTTGITIGSGQTNTNNILASGNTDPTTAAAHCDNLVVNGYSDWFLPSSGELSALRSTIGIFDISGSLYWTSSEANQYNAYLVPINATSSFGADTKDMSWGVIPVRTF